jgi:hypothetical protein
MIGQTFSPLDLQIPVEQGRCVCDCRTTTFVPLPEHITNACFDALPLAG